MRWREGWSQGPLKSCTEALEGAQALAKRNLPSVCQGQAVEASGLNRRVNAWSYPGTSRQAFTVVFFLGDGLAFNAFVVPMLRGAAQLRFLLSFTACFLVTLLCGLVATTVDPVDLLLTEERPVATAAAGQAKDELHKCFWCKKDVEMESKHCWDCSKCVAGFDHHCVWLNTCVGRRNYLAFYVTVWGFFLVVALLVGAVAVLLVELFDGGGPGASVYDNSKARLCGLCALLVLNVPFLLLDLTLAAFHSYLCFRGITTYEFLTGKVAKRRQWQQEAQKQQQSAGGQTAKEAVPNLTLAREAPYGPLVADVPASEPAASGPHVVGISTGSSSANGTSAGSCCEGAKKAASAAAAERRRGLVVAELDEGGYTQGDALESESTKFLALSPLNSTRVASRQSLDEFLCSAVTVSRLERTRRAFATLVDLVRGILCRSICPQKLGIQGPGGSEWLCDPTARDCPVVPLSPTCSEQGMRMLLLRRAQGAQVPRAGGDPMRMSLLREPGVRAPVIPLEMELSDGDMDLGMPSPTSSEPGPSASLLHRVEVQSAGMAPPTPRREEGDSSPREARARDDPGPEEEEGPAHEQQAQEREQTAPPPF